MPEHDPKDITQKCVKLDALLYCIETSEPDPPENDDLESYFKNLTARHRAKDLKSLEEARALSDEIKSLGGPDYTEDLNEVERILNAGA